MAHQGGFEPLERGPLGEYGPTVKWVSALSRKNRWDESLRHCISQVREQSGAEADVVLVFLTPHFADQYEQVPEDIYKQLNPKHLLGCSAGGVIAGGVEAENMPAVGLMVGNLPGVKITPFHLRAEELPD